MTTNLTICIIGAMDCEIARLKDLMTSINSINTNRLTIYEGKIGNHKIILVKSGVGKVNAALCTQYIIDKFKPQYIINTGIAGGLADNLSIGDIVIGEKLIQHDFDVSDLGYAKGYMCTGINKDEPTIYYSDEKLISEYEKAVKETNPTLQLHKGTIATGDIFVGSKEKKQNIINTFHATAVEMEGAAIAQTANLNNIPCLVIRAISDLADGRAAESLEVFETKMAELSSHTIYTLLKNMCNIL